MYARKNGVKVIITDHHLPEEILPEADAIVNPNLPNSNFPSKSLAGVGVSFYLMLALRSKLNQIGWFKKRSIEVPNLANFLDLVALGTISDLVPLDKNNRILVHHGLRRIRFGMCCIGIKMLITISRIDIKTVVSNDLSFTVSPKLNAAGRLDDMSISVALLITDDESSAKTIAVKLNNLNESRKKIEENMQREAYEIFDELNLNKTILPKVLVMYYPTWHQGIIGILASRIKEYFNRPTIIFARSQHGILKGSGRSIDGLHIKNIIEQMDQLYPGLILKFGGHRMAAGLTIEEDKFQIFQNKFVRLTEKILNHATLKNVILSDGELKGKDFSIETAELIRYAGPWGPGFPEPIFDGKFLILRKKILKKKHLKVKLKLLEEQREFNGIVFNYESKCPFDCNGLVRAAYKIDVNYRYCYGDKVQLLIQYLWPIED
ncbi:Single-stranded-DNA-specific exonuclease RecJ [Candidatus Riesia pediculischaeffi PTSU]|uniref:Single-stranded-DNA-specific exonuclease RecJ n=1 Tax=Candidatus Riesia pediculischaeffi PTSU TaxID=1401651 RepID=A0A0C1VJE3_9ENTR|nr:DHHA1 domain-containing protein [Candidatus Riesia pediculischaeffi]KIE63965.1 Single-stranded-DNA-specific exonuclease RecJ [Candidatus Riesia pediculischaeffi PTSU]